MSATINPRQSTSASSIGQDAKPTLLHKIDGHAARVNDVFLLEKDEGFWTASDDRSIRLYLKRDNGQFWPSIHHFMPVAPTTIAFCEQAKRLTHPMVKLTLYNNYRLFVGLLNGNVLEYIVAEDMNSMQERRKWSIHAGPISGLGLAIENEFIFSCSKDKSLIWHDIEHGNKMGAFHCESSCTAMAVALPFIFVGDHSGAVIVLRLVDGAAQLVSKLSAHNNSVSSLAWDRQKEVLYSGGLDNLVIMWDIGGQKGEAYELNGHSAKISRLSVASGAKRLFSADENGKIVCWDMKTKRLSRSETPAWQESDVCQLCSKHFFWNFSEMWKKKSLGNRQHHCRTCGKAVCISCCSYWTVYPEMGFELPVRICKSCHDKMEATPQEFDLTPLAVQHDLRTGISAMHFQETLAKLITIGQNRTVMIWDVSALL